MTLNEIRDDYVRSMQREFWKINREMPPMIDKAIAMEMSEAFQDIQRRHNVLQGYTTLSLVDGVNVYDLPSNFGKMKKAMYSNMSLDEVPFNEFISLVDAEGQPTTFTMYPSGNTQQIAVYPKPDDSYTLYVYYYLDLGYYSPSGDAQQDWGNFDGSVFSGSPKLPDRYNRAIKNYMLGLYFPEWMNAYERELASLRESRVTSLPKRKYSMGGYTTTKELKDMTVLTSSTTTSSTGVSSDSIPDKFLHITYDWASDTATILDSSGWTVAPTVATTGNVITVTSSGNEFSTTSGLLIPSNTMTGWSNTAGAYTVTPPTGSNIFFKIEQWA